MPRTVRMSNVTGIRASIRSFEKDDCWVDPSYHIGIELELENSLALREQIQNTEETDKTYWKITEDDSLRNNGAEFLLTEPLCGKDLSLALQEMENHLRKLKATPKRFPDPHYRTSTHVHVDIRDCTIDQYMNIVLLGILFEPALFRVAGEHRQRNNFSLGSRFSTGYFNTLSRAYVYRNNHDVMVDSLAHLYKYSAINVTPPFMEERQHPKKGSIEFRHHEGCTDMARLRIWINILMCLKKAAENKELFSEAWMKSVSQRGIVSRAREIFGDYFKYIMYDNLEIDCLEGIRLVQDVMHQAELERTMACHTLDRKLRGIKENTTAAKTTEKTSTMRNPRDWFAEPIVNDAIDDIRLREVDVVLNRPRNR